MVSWNNLLSASNSTIFHIFVKVLGLSSPAYAGGVKEGDVVVSVQDTLVTMMKHAEVSQSVLKNIELTCRSQTWVSFDQSGFLIG